MEHQTPKVSVGEKSENSIGRNIWLVLVDESETKIWDKTIGSDIKIILLRRFKR